MRLRFLATMVVAILMAPAVSAQEKPYILFESGPVRPMLLTGNRLYVANGPDNRLEVFTVGVTGKIGHLISVPVGMEPVAVAESPSGDIWVVNHLSDSISIVDVGVFPPQVSRTLLVGDEPRDIVFAGTGGTRAFITTAHRGQHREHASIAAVPGAGDPELFTEGIGRADVWVFDSASLGATIGGTPLEILELFGDTPRALAVSNDGNTVYAAVFHSGNQTAVVGEGLVCDGFDPGVTPASECAGDGITSPNGLAGGDVPGGNPGPDENHQLIAAPETGLIVKFDESSGEWQDELGRNWSNGIRFHLPDTDVFAVNANTLSQTSEYDHVGTILFNMAVNPVSGNIYVSNADSQNLTRFEGAGTFGGSTVQGNLAQYGISVLSGVSTVAPRHLNKHINYATLPAPAGTKNHTLATPTEMVVSSDGTTLYVAAFGSSKVGVYQTATLEADTFDPTVQSAQHVSLSGGGPSGLALNEAADRLYVYTRFNNSVSIVDTMTGTEVGTQTLDDPEPAAVTVGRPVLYDAFNFSSNGEASCSSCHIFGDFDSLAWDLGDPDGDVSQNTAEFTPVPVAGGVNGGADDDELHPMKGPMTTQTLRGMANSGPMHWRGDRVDGFFGMDNTAGDHLSGEAGDEDLNFRNFIVAFPGLVGGATPATDVGLQVAMADFAAFALEIALPPNPIRGLDNSLSSDAATGEDIYFNDNMDTQTCEGCHILEPENGFFGTGGEASFENEAQIAKVPHLRNMYQKVGMFGMPDDAFTNNNPGANNHLGDQVRGTGFLHDGSTDTLFRFFKAAVFELFPPFIGFSNDGQRTDMEQFMMEFPTDLAPIVGQQITDDTGANSGVIFDRIELMKTRAGTAFSSKFLNPSADVTECDLVAKGVVGGESRGYFYDPGTGNYVTDRNGESQVTSGALRTISAVAGQALTFTCGPPGSGLRMGVDRDLDGSFDGTELDNGTDPANPGSILNACTDGNDNDGDGLTDGADPGCATTPNLENPACSDGKDNDADGAIDLADPQCASAADNNERPVSSGCGLGLEWALLGLPALALRGARRRRV